MSFIPANESKWTIGFFKVYSKWLMKFSFRKVWLRLDYKPGPKTKTVYYLNHTMWWDGLIPLVLNEYVFHQKARAIMELKQMKEHTFFSQIGAFSINRENFRESIRSLRYAIESMSRNKASLFIYPEGELKPLDTEMPEFEEGLAWLAEKLEDVDFVPICIYPSFHFGHKPDLFINVGFASMVNKSKSREEITESFQKYMLLLKAHTIKHSLEPETHFKKFL